MSVLKPVIWEKLSEKEQSELLMRPAVLAGANIARPGATFLKRLSS